MIEGSFRIRDYLEIRFEDGLIAICVDSKPYMELCEFYIETCEEPKLIEYLARLEALKDLKLIREELMKESMDLIKDRLWSAKISIDCLLESAEKRLFLAEGLTDAKLRFNEIKQSIQNSHTEMSKLYKERNPLIAPIVIFALFYCILVVFNLIF